MPRVVFGLALVASALGQARLLPALGPLGVLPNPVLVLLLVWCALRGPVEGLLWVFGAGVLLDLLALDAIGTNGLALLPVAVLAVPARRRFFHSGMIVPLALAMVATVAHAAVLTMLRALADGAVPPGTAMARPIVLQAMLNALVVPPLYLLAGWMNRLAPERT